MAKKSEYQVAKTGRPSAYSEKMADVICLDIMAGKSLREICAREGMPGTATVFRWLEQYPEFRDSYARAREVQADVLADEIIEIADSETDPSRARVMIDARKWLASKLRPKKYGDRVELDHSVQGNTGIQVVVNVLPARIETKTTQGEVVQPALES